MTVLDIQRRLRQVGRIRIGVQAPTQSGRTAPRKIETFRLTSPDRRIIEAAAALYGGEAEPWSRDVGTEWQVTTTTAELPIALPPNLAISQSREEWTRGGCTKRCDGQWDSKRGVPCDCDADNPVCKLTTRLNVLLPEVPGLGMWRLDSHGYFAAVELAGAVELITQMAGQGVVIPARLRLEQRQLRRIIDGKALVQNFGVPCIDLDVSITGVKALALKAAADAPAGALDAPDALALPEGAEPVPVADEPAALSVVEQVTDQTTPKARKATKSSKAPLPATGRTPRTQTGPQVCHRCGQPYASESLVRNPDDEGGRFIHRSCESPAATSGEAPSAPTGGDVADGSRAPIEPPASARTTVSHGQRATAKQRGKIMALVAQLFPVDVERVSGPEADAYRRKVTVAMCDALGLSGITSRADIDHATASRLIDCLEAMKDGSLGWAPANDDSDTGRFVDPTTGEVVAR